MKHYIGIALRQDSVVSDEGLNEKDLNYDSLSKIKEIITEMKNK